MTSSHDTGGAAAWARRGLRAVLARLGLSGPADLSTPGGTAGVLHARRAMLALTMLAALISAAVAEHFGSSMIGEWHRQWGTMLSVLIGLGFGVVVLRIDRHLTERARLAEHALNRAGEGYLVLDAGGRIRNVNIAYCVLTGHTRDSLLDRNVCALSAVDPCEISEGHLTAAQLNGVRRFDTSHRTVSGDVPVRVTLAWVEEERHFVMIVRDRSAGLAAQRTIRERSERLARVLDATAEGIYGVDASGACTFINARALFLLGYEGEDQLLGRNMHHLIHCNAGRNEHTHAMFECAARRALRGEQSLEGIRDVFWRRDGTPLQVWYRASPIRGVNNESIVGAVVSFTDCSTEVRLRTSAERDRRLLSTVVDAIGEALILLDEHTRIAMFNIGAERIFGCRAHEASGESIDRFLSDCTGLELINHVDAHLRAAGTRGEPCTRLLEGRRENGQVFPMRASLGLVQGPAGRLVAIAMQDISDEIDAEAARRRNLALEMQASERRRFLSRMSHELRTPLNAVLGFTQLLHRQGEPMTPGQQRAIERIEIAGQHLLGMVNDLMDLSKLDLGGIHIESRVFDIGEEWPQAITLVLPMARAKNVSLRSPRYDGTQTLLWSEIEEEQMCVNAWVKADPMRVRQILVNLLSNAIKYNRVDGAVSLELRQTDTQVHLCVVDTGVGLSAEQLEHICEPFNRLGAEQTGIEGSGLGLALSRSLAQAMHGDLIIESAVGMGTRATLALPRAESPEAQVAAPAPAGVEASSAQQLGYCVLHVEDDPVNTELVSGLLACSRPDVRYVHAASGAQALAYLRDHACDVLLTDMNLGDIDGLGLLRAARATVHGAQVPVVALSGDAMTDSVARAREAGMFEYLTKPIELARLLTVLDEAAAHGRCQASLTV